MGRPKKVNLEDYKALHLRIPRPIYMYLKKCAMMSECSMTEIVVSCLDKQRKKLLKELTEDDTDV